MYSMIEAFETSMNESDKIKIIPVCMCNCHMEIDKKPKGCEFCKGGHKI